MAKKAKGKKAQKIARGKAKAAKKVNGKQKPETAKANNANGKQKPQAKKANGGNGKLAELRKEVETKLQEKKQAAAQAEELRSKAKELEQTAKQAFIEAVAPYRAECKRIGVESEFAGGKSGPVAPRVRFLLSKEKDGIKVMVKGRPETERLIPNAELKTSVGKAAFKFCEENIGPASEQGAKHAGLSHRMRQLIK